MSILIELELCKGVSWPIIQLNKKSYQFDFDENQNQHKVLLDCEKNSITLENLNKTDLETIMENGVIIKDQTVKLVSFYYDNICLDKDIIINNSKFFPNYHDSFKEYAVQNHITVLESFSTDTLYFNGIWLFDAKIDFWQWYTAKVNEKLCVSMNEEQIANYIGIPTESAKQKLELLKKVYNEV